MKLALILTRHFIYDADLSIVNSDAGLYIS